MIKHVFIRNFRSIDTLDLDLSNLNAFIGYNNSGKSNIMDALNIVMGEKWPTDPFVDSDFHNYNRRNPIVIEVKFDQSLVCNPECQGFRLTDNGRDRPEYRAIDDRGNVCQRGFLNNEAKLERTLLYLGLDRQAGAQLRTSSWTIYGKLLRHFESTLNNQLRQDFKSAIDDSYSRHLEPILRDALDSIQRYAKQQTGKELVFSFNTVDPINVLKNVKPYLVEGGGRHMDIENVGSGVQSAVSIAIARAYSEIVRVPVTIAIEEPELYLHPHACRHFYELLKELAGNYLQIIYTTHSRCFVDINDFTNIYLVNKSNDATTVKNVSTLTSNPRRNDLDIISKTDESINEIFFAESVILVEGFNDKLACREALKREGININLKNISIIDSGGKRNIKYLADLVNSFGIKCFALVDEDQGRNQQLIVDIQAIIGPNNVKVQRPDNLEGMLGFPSHLSKEQGLVDIPNWFQTVANATPQVYLDIKQMH